ncbi:MAG: winged helix DNA-binding protein [Eubacteriales bacterium]|nr:winged helix DNA-binding protein [Eubacteriales bacterium]
MELTEENENRAHVENIPSEFYLIGLINEFNNRFQAAGDLFFGELSWRQVFAINCISFFEKPPTIKNLAELMGGSHQNTKQILTRLEKAGFIVMKRDSIDARKQRIELTEKAGTFRAKHTEDSARFMQRLFAETDASDLVATIRLITQLDEKLKNYQEEQQ